MARIPASLLLLSLVLMLAGVASVALPFLAPANWPGLFMVQLAGALTFAIGAGLLGGARWAAVLALLNGAIDALLVLVAVGALVLAAIRGEWGDAGKSAGAALVSALFAAWIFFAVAGHWSFFERRYGV